MRIRTYLRNRGYGGIDVVWMGHGILVLANIVIAYQIHQRHGRFPWNIPLALFSGWLAVAFFSWSRSEWRKKKVAAVRKRLDDLNKGRGRTNGDLPAGAVGQLFYSASTDRLYVFTTSKGWVEFTTQTALSSSAKKELKNA